MALETRAPRHWPGRNCTFRPFLPINYHFFEGGGTLSGLPLPRAPGYKQLQSAEKLLCLYSDSCVFKIPFQPWTGWANLQFALNFVARIAVSTGVPATLPLWPDISYSPFKNISRHKKTQALSACVFAWEWGKKIAAVYRMKRERSSFWLMSASRASTYAASITTVCPCRRVAS